VAIYPVIMCGGAGTRLWPASRPTRPKQFLSLAGSGSLFQNTARRVAPLAQGGGSLVVVCGLPHRHAVVDQLAEIGLTAVVLLEPEARDSAPAMAAAAAWITRDDPDGVAVYVASDHHLPDDAAFRHAASLAAETAQASERILTLGVQPTGPSSAYGYIRAEHEGLSPVAAFVEKPDEAKAREFVAGGYYWNSGNFVSRAANLLRELDLHAPLVAAAAREALADAPKASVVELGAAFRRAPKVSIDYAVMEKSDSVWVLPVSFDWSDLGAWDAVAAAEPTGRGLTLHEGDGSCFVRAGDGMVVATVGVRDLAIIAEPDAVLVCDLTAAQDVKKVVDRLKAVAPQFLSHSAPPQRVPADRKGLLDWLHFRALPFWSSFGLDESGRFAEVLDASGRDVSGFHRARVPARQIYVLAAAGRLDWQGRWRSALASGLERYWSDFSRTDGDVRARVSTDGASLEEDPRLYDQAFALLALASAAGAGVDAPACLQRAERLRRGLDGRRLPAGGWRETGPRPFQANAHMHLLEASLAWETLDPDGPWRGTSDEVVALARDRFIDGATGALHEFFLEDWSGPPYGERPIVEPGHQFEWAWLLARYARARDGGPWMEMAHRLYECGMKGVHPTLAVACDQLSPDLKTCSDSARLWPQTEWLKAAVILSETSSTRSRYLEDEARARSALARYLTVDGRWRDQLHADGSLDDRPSPASSFYHIMAAMEQLSAADPG
jgi:mannose-1-phosphate guanylyltransferase/mannose-6-phosphate isomerase